jgi:DNA-binding transcriptional MerR regulator
MIDYLSRTQYLQPTHGAIGVRGKVRYYSYRDLVVARIIQRLRDTGVELARIKAAIQQLASDETWLPERKDDDPIKPLQWLVTDGKNVLLRSEDGFLDELRPKGQRSFAFVISLENMRDEVRAQIPVEKRELYTMRNDPIIEVERPQSRRRKA